MISGEPVILTNKEKINVFDDLAAISSIWQ